MDFLSPVLKRIDSHLIAEYARIHGISNKLKSWREKLPTIQAVLDSAEEKLMYDDDPATVLWLVDLRDVTYDMEDLLDHFSVDAKRNASKKRPYSLISYFPQFDPCTMISGHRMAKEIEDIDRRLVQVHNHIPILGLVQNSRGCSGNDRPCFVTTSLPEPKFVGRAKQMEELLARLTGPEATDDSVRPFTVLSIVGMGRLGKTTLAQQLYNHESLKNSDFTLKAWACVSDVFDMAAITKSILDQVAPSSSGLDKDLNQFQNSLKEELSGNKFIIVLDDVWNQEYVELESLLKPLYSGSKGSIILLTTRNIEVARLVGDRNPKQLDFLSLEECLALLAYHSIGDQNFEGHPHLREIAIQLAKKCKGLPLSIKMIGGLLHLEIDHEKWKRVLAHSTWDREGKIPPALKLSYIHLPIHLKRCFAACALFPKDYVFDQYELIRLWIVQGLLQKGIVKTYREVGMENLHQLEAMSFLQKVRDKKTCYSMHDLVNDLAKSVDVYSYFSSDEYKEGSTSHADSIGKVRHAAMVMQYFEKCLSKRFDVFRSMKKLRTFMPFQFSEEDTEPNVHVSQEVIHDLIMDMKNLKMLSLRYFKVRQVPDRIGELKLLCYVDFSNTEIQLLPKSICDLIELRSLLLRGCRELRKLPRNIHKLANLLHLDITSTYSLQEMPPRMGDLINLEILSDFVVGKEAGQELKQLGPLEFLQQELHVCNLLYVDDVEDARIANLFEKEAILELSFDWGSSSEISHEDDHQFTLLHLLQPPRKITSLVINHYGAKRFPTWFDNCSMNNDMRITLTGCRSVDSLPPLGQLPSLERLDVHGLEAVSSIDSEFYGSKRPFFRSLRSLSFEDMGAWEKWLCHGSNKNGEIDKSFPCLRQLNLKKCPKLKGGCTLSLPSLIRIEIDGCTEGLLKCLVGLTSMTKMTIRDIPQLVHFDGSFSTSWVALEELRIVGCPRFKYFVDGGGQVPPKLKKLLIGDCKDLEKVPDDFFEHSTLNKITVRGCEKLFSFPNVGLPPTLRRIKLHCCPRLSQSQLISSRLPDSLEELSLDNLEGLVSIMELADEVTHLSRSLRKLFIRGCRNLTTLMDSLQHLSTLSELTFRDCPALEMERFPDLPSNLSSFKLHTCPKVKSLPQDMHHLTSLKTLSIVGCEGITSLPRGGLPPILERLRIVRCRNLNQLIEEWGLLGLTALRQLRIIQMECVDEMECFPPDSEWRRLLPSSLISLFIKKMKKLERMPRGLKTTSPPFDIWRLRIAQG